MLWKNVQDIELWDGKEGQSGVDTDGDFGLIDAEGYSIIVSKAGAKKLKEALDKFLMTAGQDGKTP